MLWVTKDRIEGSEEEYVSAFAKEPVHAEDAAEGNIVWESPEPNKDRVDDGHLFLDPADWADMPPGTCVEVTWASLNGKRPDDGEPLTMEWCKGAVGWESPKTPRNEKECEWYQLADLYVEDHGEKVYVEVGGSHFWRITTRGQFRALCKALGIDMKAGA